MRWQNDEPNSCANHNMPKPGLNGHLLSTKIKAVPWAIDTLDIRTGDSPIESNLSLLLRVQGWFLCSSCHLLILIFKKEKVKEL